MESIDSCANDCANKRHNCGFMATSPNAAVCGDHHTAAPSPPSLWRPAFAIVSTLRAESLCTRRPAIAALPNRPTFGAGLW